MANIFIPRTNRVHLTMQRSIILVALLFVLLLTALTWTAVKAESKNCENRIWKNWFHNVMLNYYATKCG
jgi:hypothetical protein